MNFPFISGQYFTYVLGEPELYIKINVLIKITFLLDPENSKVPEGNTKEAKDKELQCISLHLEGIRLLKGIYHELQMSFFYNCGVIIRLLISWSKRALSER